MNLRQAAEMALGALEHGGPAHRLSAMYALRAALAEAEEPPRREPLTDEAIRDLWSWSSTHEAEQTATTQQHALPAPSSALTGLAPMSKPREVIARAAYGSETNREWDDCPELHHIYFSMADAVIDALAGMEVTKAMAEAAWNAPGCGTDTHATARTLWRAMVGAMRDE